MSDNVVQLVHPEGVGDGITVPVGQVLDGARHLQDVVVIGTDPDGGMYVASSGCQADTLALIELAKHWMLNEVAKLRGWHD